MSTASAVVEIVAGALTILAQIAPSVAAAFTGGRPVADVIGDARKAVEDLPEREAKGGDSTAGAWDANLKDRVSGGTKSD